MKAVSTVRKLDEPVSDLAKEIAVMADKDDRSRIFSQCLLDSFLRAEVEVVGRLVKYKNVTVLLHHYSKAELGTFAAAYDTCFLEYVLADETHLSKQAAHLQI